ncbi:hypothetical protein CW304_26250 [Bacillus sp. UFRGS-B20]|nr:hypothetical protein CW304_26250 [Bacillus sp. UFRGS-B20]
MWIVKYCLLLLFDLKMDFSLAAFYVLIFFVKIQRLDRHSKGFFLMSFFQSQRFSFFFFTRYLYFHSDLNDCGFFHIYLVPDYNNHTTNILAGRN